jgi:hypothetical protein
MNQLGERFGAFMRIHWAVMHINVYGEKQNDKQNGRRSG